MDTPLLGIHSHFSFLNGVGKIPDIVADAKKKGYSSLALTDNGTLSGIIEWYKECEKNEIRPLLGVSLYLEGNERCAPRLTLIAKNNVGFSNISNIVSESGFSLSPAGKPITKKEVLKTYRDGVVAIIPPANNGVLNEKALDWYRDVYGEDLFIGVTYQHIPECNREAMMKYADMFGIRLVLCPFIYYLNTDDSAIREVVLKIQKSGRPDIEQEIFPDADLSIAETDTLLKVMEDVFSKRADEIVRNTQALSAVCDVSFSLGDWTFPDIACVKTPEEDLKELVYDGLGKKGFDIEEEKVAKRIEKELRVIISKGYAKYFLVTKKIVDYMNENGIPTTTRGSAAGCLVSYVLGITNVDPLAYDIPFERFLNEFRPSPPDIDIDIADNERDGVIHFIRDYFGEENVAQIGTFGKMMARAVARDVARALGYPYITGDRIAKLIPLGKQGMPMTIQKALDEVVELRELYEENSDVKRILDMGMNIEGNVRHISVHAAGVVIDTDGIKNRIPIQSNPKDRSKTITQYNMHAVEDAGLLKFDILGITNLSTLKNAVRLIEETSLKKIDLETIPLDDVKTFDLLKNGFTKGLFQLGGSGVTQVVLEIQPESLENISAIIALYRPGPIANIGTYARRKKGEEAIEYLHPDMETYLKPTYGVLVYQEDVLLTAIHLAGYDWEEVDVFRKAIGKKIPELMAATESEFKKRCFEVSGLSKKQVDDVWKLFTPFQGYGFNKAHAMSYGLVAYQTAYLKAHYPIEFMCCVLESAHGDLDEIYELVVECKKMDIAILPPSVNESACSFSTEEKGIRVGFSSIKNLGSEVSECMYRERMRCGAYTTLSDFIERVSPLCAYSKRDVEALIKSGSFDCFDKREALVDSMDMILAYSKECRNKEGGMKSLFEEASMKKDIHIEKHNDYAKTQLLAWEKEYVGMYVSGNPLDSIQKKGRSIKQVEESERKRVLFTGIITSLKMHRSKRGERMCFFRLEDASGSIESVCFPEAFEKYQDDILENRPIYAHGNVKQRNGSPSLLIEKIESPLLK